ncbi:MAG TPA: cellulase family glycosylhydrolase [Gammaproteobacteria bacterium]|nr:cellulase family glycosylhydrolase [Gammaproteobacteria bacterium]
MISSSEANIRAGALRRAAHALRLLAPLVVLALSAPTFAAIHVRGNALVGGAGRTVRLLGVNRSGAEYACIQGWGFMDGPTDAPSIAAIAAWNVNVVRLPLNEDCWLGINGVDPRYGGAPYRHFVEAYVRRLHAARLAVILDLHWNAPGSEPATGQQKMADRSHAVAFWQSLARSFRRDGNVIFDVYNEPHDISWECWRDGCGPWVGMQTLVLAIRATGARQPIMLGGLAWANDLSQWLVWEPRDPLHQLVASFHLYNFNACANTACWDATVAPVASEVPVVTGELGENDCAHDFIDSYMQWADNAGVSYLGWTWDTWDCGSGPALISDYDGTPTAFGEGFKAHLELLANPAAPSP